MMGTFDPQPSMFYHINLMACGVGKWAKGNGGSVAESVRKGFQGGLRRSARIRQCRPVNGVGLKWATPDGLESWRSPRLRLRGRKWITG